MLNQVVLQHFYRHGQLEIAETLAREANLNECLKDSKQPFQELNSILESLQRRDLGPALNWAERNRLELNRSEHYRLFLLLPFTFYSIYFSQSCLE